VSNKPIYHFSSNMMTIQVKLIMNISRYSSHK